MAIQRIDVNRQPSINQQGQESDSTLLRTVFCLRILCGVLDPANANQKGSENDR